jgi:hypothetical protein
VHTPESVMTHPPNLREAKIALAWASLAYDDAQGKSDMAMLHDTDPDNFHMEHVSEQRTDTQFIFAVNRLRDVGNTYQGRRVVLAFRGTTNFADVVTDVDAALVPFPYNSDDFYAARVHRGFLKAMDATIHIMRDRLRQVLKQMQAAKFGEKDALYIVGHSLGGGIAHLVACDKEIVDMCDSPECIKVITFGCPRTGNAAFAEAFSSLHPSAVRYSMVKDTITRIPLKRMRFQHAGVVRQMRLNGSFVSAVGELEGNDSEKVPGSMLGGTFQAAKALFGALTQHGRGAYTRALKAMAFYMKSHAYNALPTVQHHAKYYNVIPKRVQFSLQHMGEVLAQQRKNSGVGREMVEEDGDMEDAGWSAVTSEKDVNVLIQAGDVMTEMLQRQNALPVEASARMITSFLSNAYMSALHNGLVSREGVELAQHIADQMPDDENGLVLMG